MAELIASRCGPEVLARDRGLDQTANGLRWERLFDVVGEYLDERKEQGG